jgi:hypothetical protein
MIVPSRGSVKNWQASFFVEDYLDTSLVTPIGLVLRRNPFIVHIAIQRFISSRLRRDQEYKRRKEILCAFAKP